MKNYKIKFKCRKKIINNCLMKKIKNNCLMKQIKKKKS